MLPFTPITEELLRESWIKEEYNVLEEAYETTLSAYSDALQLSRYDDGNTKSNTLYWIATRPRMDGVVNEEI